MYEWVSTGSARKYDRAILALKKDNKPVTEEAVKELYIKYGGLVLDVPEVEVSVEQEEEEAETKPARRTVKKHVE